MVNRIWKHHFGAGLVAVGRRLRRHGRSRRPIPSCSTAWPTGSSRDGWSLKAAASAMMVLSSAYRMTQAARRAGRAARPAEPCCCTGCTSGGSRPRRSATPCWPSPAGSTRRCSARACRHLTPFMDGRGRPEPAGPLDGDGRRSHLPERPPQLPQPDVPGLRLPGPVLHDGPPARLERPGPGPDLLNDPFVLSWPASGPRRCSRRPGTTGERIDRLYEAAFGRPPTAEEAAECLDFLRSRHATTAAWPTTRRPGPTSATC